MPEACKASSIFPKSFLIATSCSPTGPSKATSLVLLRLEFQGNKLRPGPMRLLCGSTYRQNRALLTICAHHESLCSWEKKPLVVLRWNIVNQCTRFLLYISTLNIGVSEPPCTGEAANQRAANFCGENKPTFSNLSVGDSKCAIWKSLMLFECDASPCSYVARKVWTVG